MARWLRVTGVAGLAAGAAAAATGAVLAAEKAAVGRTRLRPDPEAAEPFGQLRGRPLTVLADDGVSLHAEISGPDDAPVTIIFSHGYTLNQDAWHYQRRDLAARSRLVFWDQRAGGHAGGAGRPLYGRHDRDGAGQPAPGGLRQQGHRHGADLHRRVGRRVRLVAAWPAARARPACRPASAARHGARAASRAGRERPSGRR